MAKKTSATEAGLRGTKLIKKAIEAGRAEAFSEPEPVAAAVLKKLTLPNGEPISAAMKELLKVDALWLGIEFDEDEGDIESTSLEDLVEEHFGEDAVTQFGEAIELFDGDCIALGGASDAVRFLYVGEADESGEYPVMLMRNDPRPWIGGFIPFDVWVGQELGALPAGDGSGSVPEAYAEAVKALADANGDGRVSFESEAREAGEEEEEEGDDDSGEDDEDDTAVDTRDEEAPGEDADEEDELEDEREPPSP